MIYDTLDNASAYPLGRAFEKAIEFVRGLNADTPVGRHEIDGVRMYANVMEYETASGSPEKYEVHRRYADLQAVIAGHETVFVRPAAGLPENTPYDAKGDYAFLNSDGTAADVNVQLFPGDFALLLPQDAHMGKGMSCHGPCKLKKVVVKIALDQLSRT